MTQTSMVPSALSPATVAAGSGASAAEKAAMAKAAKAFEAVFVRQLIGTMRGASGGESIDGSSSVDQFREMADARTADDLAAKGGLGIAELILKQLDKH